MKSSFASRPIAAVPHAVVAMRVDEGRFLVDVTDMSNNFGRTLYYNACLRIHESGALAGAA